LYLVEGLPAGTFTVAVTGVDPAYTATHDVDGVTTLHTSTVSLTDGEGRTDVDFGYTALVSIGDRVWNDTDRDGVQDQAEPGLAGVTVRVLDAAGQVIATTTTDANGFYSFTGLLGATDYVVEFTAPTNTVFSPKDAGSDDVDSDADVTGKVTIRTPATGSNSATTPDLATVDAGLVSLVSIGDTVWLDVDRDGVQDAGEPAKAGITVTLRDADGEVVGTTITDAAGTYVFTGLLAGADYTVEFAVGPGWFVTQQNAGRDDALDSDIDPVTRSVRVTAPSSGSNSAAKPDSATIDAGLVSYNLTLSKTVVLSGDINPGSTVTFTLVPTNAGPSAALAGWSVTEVLPASFSLVSMTGTGYACAGMTCIAAEPLAAGAAGAPIIVVAQVATGVTGTVRNVAYVAPASADGGEVTPLVVPTAATDTSSSATDNDAEAAVVVKVPPAPVLPQTGSAVSGWVVGLAIALLVAGLAALAVGRRARHGAEADASR
jgi:uncharacterized repeat protein (TIGR01451 family)/LPXTG-motif cell wall-anchored protein